MLTEKQFEEMMRTRYIEPPSLDLAERIIAAAQESRGYSVARIVTYFREIIASILPKPSYAFAAVLLSGLIIGASLPGPNADETFTVDDEEGSIL